MSAGLKVRGYGATGDAYHVAAPTEDGDGPRRAMLSAIGACAKYARSTGCKSMRCGASVLKRFRRGLAVALGPPPRSPGCLFQAA